MKDRQFEAAENLALIGRMLDQTRRRIVRNAGRPYLIWGYATVLTTLAVGTAVALTSDTRWNWLWVLFFVVASLLTHLFRLKPAEGEAHTFVDSVIGRIWLVTGATAILLTLLKLSGILAIPMAFVILLMMGMASTMTGLIVRLTPAVLGGTAGILLAPAMFLADPRCTGGLFIAAFVAMMIVPGHILNRRSKNAR